MALAQNSVQSVPLRVTEMVTSPGQDLPSPLAQTINLMAARAGQSIAMEVKTTLMGKSSGVARQEQALQGALFEDIANQQMPIAGALMQSFPKLGKLVSKNPQLLDIAMGLMASREGRSGNGNGHDSPKFKL